MTAGMSRWQWLGRVNLDLDLAPSAKLVAYWMAEHADGDTLIAWPSVDTLARLTGLKERAVQGAREALVQRGYLALVQRAAGPRSGARYALEAGGVHHIAPVHATINAARRMWNLPPVKRPQGVQRRAPGVQRDASTGARSCTPRGARSCTQTSSSEPLRRTSSIGTSETRASARATDGPKSEEQIAYEDEGRAWEAVERAAAVAGGTKLSRWVQEDGAEALHAVREAMAPLSPEAQRAAMIEIELRRLDRTAFADRIGIVWPERAAAA